CFSVSLEIAVKDTNDHAPEFDQPWYTVEVDEGRLYAEITRLTATDKDCGHPYGQICRYEITNALKDLPFAISEQGVLRNTQPLNYTRAHSHILSIVANDCGMRKSKSTLVTVNVREACVAGVRGVEDRVDYYPGSGAKFLAPEATISTCDNKDRDCAIKRVEAVVRLRTDHIAQGCDRDAIASKDARDRCGLNAATVDLLPRPELANAKEENDVTADLDENYFFDGNDNAVIVPAETAKPLVPAQFTLSFSMKHAEGSVEEQKAKHTILCESDDAHMNRHHFAVYVRHCKLEMLMRREHESEPESRFRPAEWRWKLAEACDNNWHHYAVLFRSVDQVELYIDGKLFESNDKNPEILDDWPLHQTKDLKTRLVVGACWHSRAQKMSQFFKGHLAGMLYLPSVVESPSALQCMHQCKEQLQFNGLDTLVPGEEAIFNRDMSVLTLKATTAEDVAKLLRQVAYVNLRSIPTPGHRGFDMETTIECAAGDRAPLPAAKGYVFVQKAAPPVLKISGQSVVIHTREDVKNGAVMLPDVKITVTQPDTDGSEHETTPKHMLDWCKVHLTPGRDMDLEYFSSPASLIASMHLDFEHDKDGLLVKGIEKVKGYREVLSKIHYFNVRPDSYSKRTYVVQCSMLNGSVLSNEFTVSMSIEAPKPQEVPAIPAEPQPAAAVEEPAKTVVEAVELEHEKEPVIDEVNSHRLQNILEMDLPRPKAMLNHRGYDVGQGAIAGGAVAVVVVVCVGFLLVLLVVGVLRMRGSPPSRSGSRRRGARKATNPEAGMEWDGQDLNITVNPLDAVDAGHPEAAGNQDDYTDEDSSDGGDSYRDEELTDDDEEDEVEEVLPHVTSSNGTSSSSDIICWA
uniref:Cadherin domain-containing protein n=1 Tax=Plectus sambesii TaxID=2011161 RepID=A0A914X2J0_9BILA